MTSSCDYCPVKDQCVKFWKDYQTQFDSCIDGIDAKQVCARLGFCNASKLCANMGTFQQACEETLNAFLQGSKVIEEHLPHTSVVVLPTQPKDIQNHEITMDSNSTCILCEYVMNILANYIHQQSTEQEIEQSLEKVCNQMPATLRNQCHELVENYGPSIIATLIGDFDVSSVCRKLNLCTNQMKVDLTHVTKASVVSCSICDYVSTYLEFALKRDSSEKSLQRALGTVCSHLSSEQVSQCQTLIQLFSPYIRKLELQLGKNFCRQLGICQADKEKPSIIGVPLENVDSSKDDEALKATVVNNLDDTPQCMLCRYVVTYLDAVLKTNKSAAAIEAALEKVCTILPSKERAECDQFVKTYGPVLAEIIAETADPDTVCRYLGVCQVVLPSSKPVTYPNHDYVTIPKEQESYTCTICEFLISRMKHYAAENQTEEEILASLRKSCDLFAVVNLKQQCESFLDQYAPYIIQMISSDVQPKIACQSLGLCEKSLEMSTPATRRQSTPAVQASSTRYGKCIFGMNYWCTSRQNAQLCNVNKLIYIEDRVDVSIFRLSNYANVKSGRRRIRKLLFKSIQSRY